MARTDCVLRIEDGAPAETSSRAIARLAAWQGVEQPFLGIDLGIDAAISSLEPIQ